MSDLAVFLLAVMAGLVIGDPESARAWFHALPARLLNRR